MCMSPLAMLSPAAAAIKGKGTGLAMLSPAAAIASKLGGKKNKDMVSSTPPSTQTAATGASY